MKYSVEKDIVRYPTGMETSHPPEVVDAYTFHEFNLGSGRYVWRTTNGELEVGKVGGVYYGKVLFRILEGIFSTPRSAMRRCGVIRTMMTNGEIVTPPLVTPSHG